MKQPWLRLWMERGLCLLWCQLGPISPPVSPGRLQKVAASAGGMGAMLAHPEQQQLI